MTIRPYLPAPRATVRRVTRRRGQPPPATSAALRSKAIAYVASAGRPSGSDLARELGVSPKAARLILAELRAAGLAPPALVGPTGRRTSAPPQPGRVVRLPAALLRRLEAYPGDGTVEQIGAALDLLDPAPRGKE